MSKSVLVIETPKTCAECPLSFFADPDGSDDMFCMLAKDDRIEEAFTVRAGWCPLKPMPGRNVWDKKDFADGWNACINAMRGEEE